MIQYLTKSIGCGLVLALASALSWPSEAAANIEESRNVLARLVETKRMISQERNEWAVEQQILTDTIETLERQIVAIEQQLAEIEDTTTEAETQRAELQKSIENLEKVLAIYEPVIRRYETRMRELLRFLPDPLTARVRRLADQLPREGERGSRRLLNNRAVVLIGLLDEINNFHNSVQVHQQLLSINGAAEREFYVLYFGLSGAFFVDETQTQAGVGRPTPDGWVFEPRSGIATEVLDAVQIQEKRKMARFTRLPVEVIDIK